jgi:catechol 2,3-dioxygenase-like lactoylglutathione lyase family enzyme
MVGAMDIEFVSTVAMIVSDPSDGQRLFVAAMGLPLRAEADGYVHSEEIAGCKSFGIWPLSQAANACFGTDEWPAVRPVPQVSIEFDVASAEAVDPAAQELERAGHELLHKTRQEPWGQTVARLQSPDGAIVGISYTPLLHE